MKIYKRKQCTDESEIQEVNPPKTVAPPPTALPLNEKRYTGE